MQIEKLLNREKAEAHLYWLKRAKTVNVDDAILTVLPYGFLTQAIEKSTKRVLNQFIDGLIVKIEQDGEEQEDNIHLDRLQPRIAYFLSKNEMIAHLKITKKQLKDS